MANPYRGKFITIEGPDASGKTTSIEDLKSYLNQHPELCQDRFSDVLFLREPGGTPINDKIREIILSNHDDEPLYSVTQVFLFAANRYQNLREVIIPALRDNKLVICDRFLLSTLAYQTNLHYQTKAFQESEINRIMDIHKHALYDLESEHYITPDLTIYFDVNTQTVKDRMQNRLSLDANEIDYFDQAILDDLNRVTKLKQQYDTVYNLIRQGVHPLLNNLTKINANLEQEARLNQILVTVSNLVAK